MLARSVSMSRSVKRADRWVISFFMRRGVGRGKECSASRLHFGDQDPQPRVCRHQLVLGRGKKRPRSAFGPLIGALNQGQPRRIIRRRVEDFGRLRMKPGGINNLGATTPSFGQTSAQVTEVDAKLRDLQPVSRSGVVLVEPSDDPRGIDGRHGPSTQTMKQARLNEAFRVGVTGLPGQPAGGDAHGDGMSPEALKSLSHRARRRFRAATRAARRPA